MLDLPQVYAEHIHVWLPELLSYVETTLRIAAVSFALAVVIGLAVALGRTSRARTLKTLAAVYVEIGRGLPIVVILYIVYFVPPRARAGGRAPWSGAP